MSLKLLLVCFLGILKLRLFLPLDVYKRQGPYLSPNVAVQPLSPATDRRLGGPLPHQLANQTRGHLSAINLWHFDHAIKMRHAVLAVVSNCCPPLKGKFLTRYSPVRH